MKVEQSRVCLAIQLSFEGSHLYKSVLENNSNLMFWETQLPLLPPAGKLTYVLFNSANGFLASN